MSRTVIDKCDLCGAGEAHQLPVWFEWEQSSRSVGGNAVQMYISGIKSAGWARYDRVIYLCKDHHDKLDTLINDFVSPPVKPQVKGLK